MKKEEILMGLAISALCMGASSFAVRSPNSLTYYQNYSGQSETSSLATIETLPDGHYRFCSEPAPSDGSEAGVCFRFQKVGDRVVGNYQPANSTQPSVCLAGRINRSTINGEATDFTSPTADLLQLRPELKGGELVNWDAASSADYLKVSSGRAIDPQAGSGVAEKAIGSVHFRQAALNLSSFHQYSAGSIEPPTQCGGAS